MDHNAIPIIRIEIEHMKHSIISHIGALHSDLGEALSVEIEKALANYDWQGQVTKIVHDAITKQIAWHFNHGDGKDMVESAVAEGFDKCLNIS